MTEEARKKQNEYLREWRRRNKDKVKAQRERYWEKKAREDGTNKQQAEGRKV